MPPLIIASTKPRMGKTSLVASIAHILGSESSDIKIGVLPSNENAQKDIENIKKLLSRKKRCQITQDFFLGSKNKKKSFSDILKSKGIIEGSDDVRSNMSLAEDLDGRILLIVNFGDDIINIAKKYRDRLLGVIVNNVSKHRIWNIENELIPELNNKKIKFLGWIPDERKFLAPSISDVVNHLDGEYVTEKYNDKNLLDNFLIGGLVLDWGPTYFSIHEKTGVIVRGDRPDVQLAALHTEKTKAIFLTKGLKPVEYVFYEAQQSKIPLVVVSGDTHDVAEKLEDLQPKIDFNHKEKLDYMVKLVKGNVDISLIINALEKTPTG